jgi:DNA-binding MarR family transcriptional regulator
MRETYAQAKKGQAKKHGPDRGLRLLHRRQGRSAGRPARPGEAGAARRDADTIRGSQVLSDADGQTGAELGARLGIDSATTTGVADRLAGNGLLERRPDPQDRRLQRLSLTPEARARQPTLDHEMDQLNREVESDLDADAGRLWSRLRQLGARKA